MGDSMNTKSATRPTPNDEPAPTLLRVGVPILLALLAAAFNALAVRKQIAHIDAYELVKDVKIGTILSADDLHLVKVAGNLDKRALVTKELLNRLFELGESSSEQSNLILTRNMAKGELLTMASLGGRGTVQAGANQELVHVPRAIIRGNGKNLQPGQLVYFIVFKKRADEKSETVEIGPFQVAVERAKEKESINDRDSICLIYSLDANGRRTESTQWLHRAIFGDAYSLAAIEKSASSPPSR